MKHTIIPRMVTGAVYAFAIFGTLLFLPPIIFTILLVIAYGIVITRELPRLIPKKKMFWVLLPLYPTIPVAILIWCNHTPHYQPLVLITLGLAMAHDSVAYITGTLWGTRKLVPTISPGKTWIGFWGGVCATIAGWFLFNHLLQLGKTAPTLLALGIISACITTAGDLSVSWFKRNARIKHTGTLLPGHGGILDRIDSSIFLIVFLFLVKNTILPH